MYGSFNFLKQFLKMISRILSKILSRMSLGTTSALMYVVNSDSNNQQIHHTLRNSFSFAHVGRRKESIDSSVVVDSSSSSTEVTF